MNIVVDRDIDSDTKDLNVMNFVTVTNDVTVTKDVTSDVTVQTGSLSSAM